MNVPFGEVAPRAYDGFVARLVQGPIAVSDALSEYDGETRCVGCGEEGCVGCSMCGPTFEIRRTVLHLEYAGYRLSRRYRRFGPYVREVFSCGHSGETAAGNYNWRKPRKTGICGACSDAISVPVGGGAQW